MILNLTIIKKIKEKINMSHSLGKHQKDFELSKLSIINAAIKFHMTGRNSNVL